MQLIRNQFIYAKYCPSSTQLTFASNKWLEVKGNFGLWMNVYRTFMSPVDGVVILFMSFFGSRLMKINIFERGPPPPPSLQKAMDSSMPSLFVSLSFYLTLFSSTILLSGFFPFVFDWKFFYISFSFTCVLFFIFRSFPNLLVYFIFTVFSFSCCYFFVVSVPIFNSF